MSFPGELPAEVLLLIFEHLLPAEPDMINLVKDAYPPLLAACLCSRRFSRLAAVVLYQHVYFADRAKVEMFLRTAGCERWTTGPMGGMLKKAVRGLYFDNFGQKKNETRLLEWVLSVVQPASVRTIVLGDLCVALAALEPVHDLRDLSLNGSTLLLAENYHLDRSRPFAQVTRLRFGELTRVRYSFPWDHLTDDPYEQGALAVVDSEWRDFLDPYLFPALTSLRLDGCRPSHPNPRAPATQPSPELLSRLTHLDTLTGHTQLDVTSSSTWQALSSLEYLALRPASDAARVPPALLLALEHLPGPLDTLDLAAWMGDARGRRAEDAPRTLQVLKEALADGAAAVCELRRLILPGEGRWGRAERNEAHRAHEVGHLAEVVRVAGKGRVKIEYA